MIAADKAIEDEQIVITMPQFKQKNIELDLQPRKLLESPNLRMRKTKSVVDLDSSPI